MYHLMSSCSILIHMLLKYPVLGLVMGLIGASIFLMPIVKTPEGLLTQWDVESNPDFSQRTSSYDTDPTYLARQRQADQWFAAMVEREKGNPGMTKLALGDLERKVNAGEFGKYPDCPIDIPVLLKTDWKTLEPYARLYFYDLVRKYDDPGLATLAYKFGPGRADKLTKSYWENKLPVKERRYLEDVRARMGIQIANK